MFLGPHDITCSMEIPEEYGNPLFQNALIDVVRRCRKMNKGVGLHSDAASDFYQVLMKAGLNYVLNAADVTTMRGAVKSDFTTLRERYGDTYEKNCQTLKGSDSCISKNA